MLAKSHGRCACRVGYVPDPDATGKLCDKEEGEPLRDGVNSWPRQSGAGLQQVGDQHRQNRETESLRRYLPRLPERWLELVASSFGSASIACEAGYLQANGLMGAIELRRGFLKCRVCLVEIRRSAA